MTHSILCVPFHKYHWDRQDGPNQMDQQGQKCWRLASLHAQKLLQGKECEGWLKVQRSGKIKDTLS